MYISYVVTTSVDSYAVLGLPIYCSTWILPPPSVPPRYTRCPRVFSMAPLPLFQHRVARGRDSSHARPCLCCPFSAIKLNWLKMILAMQRVSLTCNENRRCVLRPPLLLLICGLSRRSVLFFKISSWVYKRFSSLRISSGFISLNVTSPMSGSPAERWGPALVPLRNADSFIPWEGAKPLQTQVLTIIHCPINDIFIPLTFFCECSSFGKNTKPRATVLVNCERTKRHKNNTGALIWST